MAVYSIDRLMAEARRLAAEFRRTTGKTLPVSGEIAVYDAIRLLGLEPVPAGTVGYDAVRVQQGQRQRVQVKGRVVFDDSKGGHRIGQLRAGQQWDLVVLVLMDDSYEAMEIHAATRAAVLGALEQGAGRGRAHKGALSVARFRNIGRLVWSRELGTEDNGYWSNAPS